MTTNIESKTDTPLLFTLERAEQRNIIESIIFAASPKENLTLENICSITKASHSCAQTRPKAVGGAALLDGESSPQPQAGLKSQASLCLGMCPAGQELTIIIAEINSELEATNRPYRIVNFANCYQFATLPQYGEFVENMLSDKTKKRFTAAQLETLAIIAYKQPVTKPEIDRIRGVMSSGEILNMLIEKELVESVGRKEVIGKPLLYATTNEFLRVFGLNELSDLPKLKDIEDILALETATQDDADLVLDIKEG